MQKKQTILVVASLLVVVLSVTLAYFTAQIIGKGKDVSVSSADLKIIFTDSDGAISGSNIEPGWSDTKTFTVENKSNETYKYNIVIQDLVNTFVTNGYLQYKITSTNNGYNMTEFKDVPKSSALKDTILAYSASIEVGVKQTYTVEFIYKNDESVDQSKDMGKTLSGKLFITEGTEAPTLLSQILKDNPTRSSRSNNNNGTNDFATPLTATTTGTLFTSTESITGITDSPKEVYYYAGNTTNNWVKFGGYYWRIIRTNHDGSIRLLYSGTSHNTTEGYIGKSQFNTTSNDPMYVGYMYGTSGSLALNRDNTNNSTIKTYIDNWYNNNLSSYSKYISTEAVYCNDRQLASGQTYSTRSNFNYAPNGRLATNKTPTYNCTNSKDAFSGSNSEAKLTYPIGLMTTDEIAFAGGVWKTNAPTWYYKNSTGESITGSTDWWSLSPMGWEGHFSSSWRVYGSSNPGYLFNNVVNNAPIGVRPAISLKSCIKYSTGNGTPEIPYEIVETSSGC